MNKYILKLGISVPKLATWSVKIHVEIYLLQTKTERKKEVEICPAVDYTYNFSYTQIAANFAYKCLPFEKSNSISCVLLLSRSIYHLALNHRESSRNILEYSHCAWIGTQSIINCGSNNIGQRTKKNLNIPWFLCNWRIFTNIFSIVQYRNFHRIISFISILTANRYQHCFKKTDARTHCRTLNSKGSYFIWKQLVNMAKWGEGDPRWIVEERPDATNVNNWHWTEKNATPWSKDRLHALLDKFLIKDDDMLPKCTVYCVDRIDGEATANNRKGKLIFFYEWYIVLKWEGKMSYSKSMHKGRATIPNLSEENELDDIEITITVDQPCKEAERLKQFMYNVGRSKIREQLGIYLRELREEFSKGLILPKKDEVKVSNNHRFFFRCSHLSY